ncbi:hypothetical protein YOLOSWAG_70 [Erwinia phage vB_EamM_Yoloswag]|uniref:Uncharacterized protein n=1 Tax=Erwinia phage vB_EamM_Yoloswag TaxID=1958956 RepID=A0A1S6L307_9CAUD|nr:hypothetical protein HOR66_gp070 [Erwinia phage vB_EamM_Yoloswag]AQT28553.1 hypothetical protein YOLOSWAG_70 [Erwinia phage vB_EamM_Yoloswag]
MKFSKGTAAALHLGAIGEISSAAASTTSNLSWALFLYKGTVPDYATVNAALNAPNILDTGSANREPYLNYQDVIMPRVGDYLGAVTGRTRFDGTFESDVGRIVARINSAAISGASFGPSKSPRASYILADGTPTWFVLAALPASSITLDNPLTGNGTNVVFGVFGTVGDENSTADLRIKGGRVYANSADITDQSRSINLSDLRIKLN